MDAAEANWHVTVDMQGLRGTVRSGVRVEGPPPGPLVKRAVSGEQVLLPIWHNITKKEVIQYSPSLADKLARRTAMHTVEEIAAKISKL